MSKQLSLRAHFLVPSLRATTQQISQRVRFFFAKEKRSCVLGPLCNRNHEGALALCERTRHSDVDSSGPAGQQHAQTTRSWSRLTHMQKSSVSVRLNSFIFNKEWKHLDWSSIHAMVWTKKTVYFPSKTFPKETAEGSSFIWYNTYKLF